MYNKPVIGLDLDECLGQFVYNLAIFYNRKYGTHYKVDDFNSYTFWQVWGGTPEECAKVIDSFFNDPLFTDGIPVVDGSIEALTTLKEKFDIYIVTSRHLCTEVTTRKWLDQYFSGLIKEVFIGNLWNKEGKKITKKEMCQHIGACILIDDNWNYVNECKDIVKIPILFGIYGWNRRKDESDYNGMLCCKNWEEVVNILMNYDFTNCICLLNKKHMIRRAQSNKQKSLFMPSEQTFSWGKQVPSSADGVSSWQPTT